MERNEMNDAEKWNLRLTYEILQKRMREEVEYAARRTGLFIGERTTVPEHTFLGEHGTYWDVGDVSLQLCWSKYYDSVQIYLERRPTRLAHIEIKPIKGDIEKNDKSIDKIMLLFMREIVKEARHGTH